MAEHESSQLSLLRLLTPALAFTLGTGVGNTRRYSLSGFVPRNPTCNVEIPLPISMLQSMILRIVRINSIVLYICGQYADEVSRLNLVRDALVRCPTVSSTPPLLNVYLNHSTHGHPRITVSVQLDFCAPGAGTDEFEAEKAKAACLNNGAQVPYFHLSGLLSSLPSIHRSFIS